MAELVRLSTHMLEAAGWAVTMIAVAASTVAYVRRVRASGFEASYRSYRADLGRGILLGLELLIAADILKTVVIDPTLNGLAVLGGIVLIRTFLSFSLDVEINGHGLGSGLSIRSDAPAMPLRSSRRRDREESDVTGPDQSHDGPSGLDQGSFWTSRAFFVCATLLVIAGVLLWTEHLAHALGILPYLLFIACPLMHMFMHGRHNGHAHHQPKDPGNRTPTGDQP